MKVLGTKVDNLSQAEVIATIEKVISEQSETTRLITTLNPEIALKSIHDRDYQKVLNQSFLTVADGTGIIWASKKYQHRLKAKITGIDLILRLAEISPVKKWRWFLLGGQPGVAKKAANQLAKTYPSIKIVKTDAGGIINRDNLDRQNELADKIAKYQPDILIVSLGAPIQEQFIYRYRHQLKAKIAIGAGGSLDFIAGSQKRAPKPLRYIGLEWLWRWLIDPKRYHRIWNAVVVFPLSVYRDIKRTRKQS